MNKLISCLSVVFAWVFLVLLFYQINLAPTPYAIGYSVITEPMTIITDKPVLVTHSIFKNISGNALTLNTKSGYNTISYCSVDCTDGYTFSITDGE